MSPGSLKSLSPCLPRIVPRPGLPDRGPILFTQSPDGEPRRTSSHPQVSQSQHPEEPPWFSSWGRGRLPPKTELEAPGVCLGTPTRACSSPAHRVLLGAYPLATAFPPPHLAKTGPVGARACPAPGSRGHVGAELSSVFWTQSSLWTEPWVGVGDPGPKP